MIETDATARSPRWPWLALALAVAWSVVLRLPLIVNAPVHLDSDLAVDGLTALDASRGHLRWHYPGTPHIGSPALLFGLPITLIAGPTPESLAIEGVAINALGIVATFILAWRLFGHLAASWSLVPLAFASTGMIWLSGRITGGHLLDVAWHAVAFTLLLDTLRKGGTLRTGLLGLWTGLGLWNDSMFLMTIVGFVPAGILGWWLQGRSRRGLVVGIGFIAGLAIGLVPKVVGDRVDPHDAYREQFAPIWKADVLLAHAKILGLDCLPRLVAGHRLPGFEAEPGGIGPDGQAVPALSRVGAVPILATLIGLTTFAAAFVRLAREVRSEDVPGGMVVMGLLLCSAAVLGAFVISRNIFNSDNYRYLVILVVPLAVGFGRLMGRPTAIGRAGQVRAGLIALGFAVVFSVDALDWYRALGWVDRSGLPTAHAADDPILSWLEDHREVGELYGGYWDVYRLSFLTRGRVKGVPSGHFPNRFPDASAGHPAYLLARPTLVGSQIRQQALRDGGADVFQGGSGVIVRWPPSRGTP